MSSSRVLNNLGLRCREITKSGGCKRASENRWDNTTRKDIFKGLGGLFHMRGKQAVYFIIALIIQQPSRFHSASPDAAADFLKDLVRHVDARAFQRGFKMGVAVDLAQKRAVIVPNSTSTPANVKAEFLHGVKRQLRFVHGRGIRLHAAAKRQVAAEIPAAVLPENGLRQSARRRRSRGYRARSCSSPSIAQASAFRPAI